MNKKMMFLICVVFPFFQTLATPPRRTDAEYKKAIIDGAETGMRILVVGDNGEPIRGASVRVSFAMREKFTDAIFDTGIDGIAVVRGKTTGNKIRISVEKDGYYSSMMELSYLRFAENRLVVDGKWQPWNEMRKLRLRKTIRSHGLSSYNRTLTLSTTNMRVGIDFELGDFVKPYGQGRIPDAEVRVVWDGKEPYLSKICKMEMRFVQPMSGAYNVDNVVESEMPFPYVADVNADYQTTFEYYDRKDGHICRATLFPTDTKVARVRCKISKDGKLESANYCNIRRLEASPGFQGRVAVGISGVFNPEVNDIEIGYCSHIGGGRK